MKKVNKEDLEKIVSLLENGANLTIEEVSLFKKSEYCNQVINLGNRNMLIILNKPINDQKKIAVYYYKENKSFPYSTKPKLD